jgi:hypothetical protein
VFGRRRRREIPPELVPAFRDFLDILAVVEAAKATLASAAPRGRGEGIPLAQALLGFQSGLDDAESRMLAWRVDQIGAEWDRCRWALEEAGRRSERFRLDGAPEGYEQLYGVLGDLLEPLEAFALARERFRELGV